MKRSHDTAFEVASDLVKQLNDPRQRSRAAGIASELQNIQASKEGWHVANELLASDDPDLQFYGALTFQVKLNKDGHALDDGDAQELLRQLLDRLKVLVSVSTMRLRVIDKLCSVLATFLLQVSWKWERALQCVLTTFATNQATTQIEGPVNAQNVTHTFQVDSTSNQPFQQNLSQLTPAQLYSLLRLAKILAEDINRVDSGRQDGHAVSATFQTNTTSFVACISMAVQSERHRQSGQIVDEVLASYLAWTAYADTHINKQSSDWAILQRSTDFIITLFQSEEFAHVFGAADALANVLKDKDDFITECQHMEVWPLLERAQYMARDLSPEETLPLLQLAVGWGRANMKEIFWHPTKDPKHFKLLTQMTQGFYDVDWAEDDVEQLRLMFDFWDAFGEQLLDLETFDNPLSDADKHNISDIVLRLLQALFDCFAPRDDMTSLDTDIKEEYQRLRLMFADLCALFFNESFIDVYGTIADQLETAVPRGLWLRVESAVHLLGDLSREWSETPINEQGLDRVFKSPLFDVIGQSTADMSTRLKRRLIIFIDGYSFHLSDSDAAGHDRLPVILGFVMAVIEQHSKTHEKLGDLAAKCLDAIAVACRTTLVKELPDLMSFCGRILTSGNLSAYQKSKIYSSMTSVVTALPDDRATIAPLKMILEQIRNDLQAAKDDITDNDAAGGEQALVAAFKCLHAVSESLWKWPKPIIIEEDDDNAATNGDHEDTWTTEEGSEVRKIALSCIQFIDAAPRNGDAWEELCAILRTSMSQPETGPFTFPPPLITSVLQQISLEHPRVEALLGLASTFISSVSRSTAMTHVINGSAAVTNRDRHLDEVNTVINTVTALFIALSIPEADPASAQLCVDFFDRVLIHYPDLFLAIQMPTLPNLLSFSLACFTSTATILKRATAAFLSSLLLLPSSLAKCEGPKPPIPGLQEYSEQVVTELMPLVAKALANQLGGAAARSELDAVAKVLRSLMTAAGPRFKGLLETALRGDSFPFEARQRIQDKDLRMFVQKIVMLRGGRGALDVCREFWALCRGTVSTF